MLHYVLQYNSLVRLVDNVSGINYENETLLFFLITKDINVCLVIKC